MYAGTEEVDYEEEESQLKDNQKSSTRVHGWHVLTTTTDQRSGSVLYYVDNAL